MTLTRLNEKWKSSTTLIFWGVLALTVFGWIAGVFEYFSSIFVLINNVLDLGASYLGGTEEVTKLQQVVNGFFNGLRIFQWLTIAGWVAYIIGLSDFKNAQLTGNAKSRVSSLNTACWLGLIAIFLSFLASISPLPIYILLQITAWILTLVSYMKFRSNFGALQFEESWNERAQRGASSLKWSATYNLWLMLMPFVIFIIVGLTLWSTVKSALSGGLDYHGGGSTFDQIFATNVGILVFEGVVFVIILLVLSFMQIWCRIAGWHRVMTGQLVRNDLVAAQASQSTDIRGVAAGGACFCPACGSPLSNGAKFCANCGSPLPEVTIQETASTVAEPNILPASQDFETEDTISETTADAIAEGNEEDNEASNRKKLWLITGGCVLAVLLILWITFGTGKSDEATTDNSLNEEPELIEISEHTEESVAPAVSEKTIEESETSKPEPTEEASAEPEGDQYTHTYQGTLNDKYGIEMTLTSDGGAYYTGEYFYTKNKTPIQLRGQLVDDYEHLVLEEYVGMNMTGKFDGILSVRKYSGTWTSADGEKSFPFSVTLK